MVAAPAAYSSLDGSQRYRYYYPTALLILGLCFSLLSVFLMGFALSESIVEEAVEVKHSLSELLFPTTYSPTSLPTKLPTLFPTTQQPTLSPSLLPTQQPTSSPSLRPSSPPTHQPTSLQPTALPTTQKSLLALSLDELEERCKTPQSLEERAFCGSDYDLPSSSIDKESWNVLFVGDAFSNPQVPILLGCPKQCPLSPQCKITFTLNVNASTIHVNESNVIVVHQDDFKMIPLLAKTKPAQSLLGVYWREAINTYVSVEVQQLTDFEIGVHLHAKITNPQFFPPPQLFIHSGIPHNTSNFEQRAFALYVTSNCKSKSMRNAYLARLEAALTYRVNKYGACFNNRLPGNTLLKNSQFISAHKFYFAFENTIQAGYTTEKLFYTLQSDVIPVYFGAVDAPNITQTKSYIRASDFATPERLAEYLMFVSNNATEFDKYFEWKATEGAFDPGYLKLVAKQHWRPEELREARKFDSDFKPRLASCCRLCNREYMLNNNDNANRQWVPAAMGRKEMRSVFYDNTEVDWLD